MEASLGTHMIHLKQPMFRGYKTLNRKLADVPSCLPKSMCSFLELLEPGLFKLSLQEHLIFLHHVDNQAFFIHTESLSCPWPSREEQATLFREI